MVNSNGYIYDVQYVRKSMIKYDKIIAHDLWYYNALFVGCNGTLLLLELQYGLCSCAVGYIKRFTSAVGFRGLFRFWLL